MVRKRSNDLQRNLPQLQNLIKRDPTSYKDEFLQQLQYFQSVLEVFQLSPEKPNSNLDELLMFLAQVSHCYVKELETFPNQLINTLRKYNVIMDNKMRMSFCQALILLRNKNLLVPTDLLEIFFQLLRCQDKNLHRFLQNHIVNDVKNLNSKHKNCKTNTKLQNFMFNMVNDSDTKAAKMSVDIMIELYKKNIWNDIKTVNVIATGCFSKTTKVMVTCLKFFLGKDEEEEDDSDSSDDEVDPKAVIMANKFNKKSRKRERTLTKVKKLAKKSKNKSKAPAYNFSALHLIHDPQGMADKLFKQLENTTKRFEVKLVTLDVISRLIGLHNLFLLNFYPYVQRFLFPHQREVTRILQFVAQASHDLVPPDVMRPVLMTIVNNFVTERNSSDVMAVGLNAVREICVRCPLVMDEDLLRDLVQYKSYRDRSVMMAAQSLIHLFRLKRPELLHKNDRGIPTETQLDNKISNYGEVDAKDYIPGAEILLEPKDGDDDGIESDICSESDDDWIDVNDSAGEITDNSKDEDDLIKSGNTMAESKDDLTGSKDDLSGSKDNLNESKNNDPKASNNSYKKSIKTMKKKNVRTKNCLRKKKMKNKVTKRKVSVVETLDYDSKKNVAKQISLDRIFTDEDFKRIELTNLKKQMNVAKKGLKRKLDESDVKDKPELVKLGDIENIYKKQKHDKQSRIESVRKGQLDREKFGFKDGRKNVHCSKTNREKRKSKNYQMVKHKVKGKAKKSFKEKQIALRNHLTKLKKMR